ncbi:hypothetical protein [Streptomyces yaizuensis]|uniref:VCBS repeat-containing protein n=1 Tax=Streptomyces yaizuensis TaxID=2989713 RepID=A0ABQ5NTC2_9ACTN|nr:hypothetical protein [Streptomyces sp. YSPA8]GLF93398.1 hypothetical protein SYYSPA8_03895 [Streptomyces sp. YSPA8]
MNARGARHVLGSAAVLAVAGALTVPAAAHSAPGEVPPATTAAAAPQREATAPPADVDGDGYGDLVVSAAGAGTATTATTATTEEALTPGCTAVLHGSRTGPLHARRHIVHQDSPGVPGTPESGDAFGSVTTTGDLDRDGCTDLVRRRGGYQGRHHFRTGHSRPPPRRAGRLRRQFRPVAPAR